MSESVQDSSISKAENKQFSILKKINSTLFDHFIVTRSFFVLALIYTLFFAREVVVPIFLAFLLYFLLFPIVNFLKNKLHIPRSLGSALILIILLIILGYAFYFLYSLSKDWVNNAPHILGVVNQKLEALTSWLKKPFELLSAVSHRIESSLNLSGMNIGTSWFSIIFSNTWEFFIEFFMTLIILYFLLASKTFFLTKIIKLLLKLKQDKEAQAVVRQIEKQVWNYLFYRTMINIGVAIVVSLMLWAFQLPDPLLWGIIAGILEFIPYIGALISLILIFFVSLISFNSLWHILLPSVSFLVFISLEGNFLVPYVLGRSMIINKVAVVFSIFFLGWIWGVIGSFLAVPLLITIKIIFDNLNADSFVNKLLEE
jgi:predicted PurR-regulated permease PerM